MATMWATDCWTYTHMMIPWMIPCGHLQTMNLTMIPMILTLRLWTPVRTSHPNLAQSVHCLLFWAPSVFSTDLTSSQDEPHLHNWFPLVPQFLNEFLRHEVPVLRESKCCVSCLREETLFCCVSCYEGFMFCGKCIVWQHYANPFHRIQVCIS